MMVRPNKTKPEGYMRPLAVPGGRGQFPMPAWLKQPVARVRIPAGLFRRCCWGTIADFQHTDMEWLIYELNGVRRPMQDLTVGVGSAVAFSPLRRLAEGAYCVA